MRFLTLFLILALNLAAAQSSDEKDMIAVVQKVFDAIAAHDSIAARAVMLPEGRLYSAREDGKVISKTLGEFADGLTSMTQPGLERMWNPKVLIRGHIGHVWADYDFYLAGKFHHCGIDSFSMLKTPEGWKISGVEYTSEVSGCTPNPLGPPRG